MRILRVSALLLLLLAISGEVFGQAGATGTILGTVTDPSGAVVPNAKITVTNTATKVSFQTVTNSAGDFNAPALNPGTYTVAAEARGFQKAVISSFTLTVNQHARVDLTLKPGAVTETVTTTAQAVSLDTDTAELSNLVSQQQVEDLPLNGRNFMQLLLVGAGAVTVGGEQGTMRQGEGNAISVNGGRPEGNNYTLDGLVNTDAALVTPAVILSQDAIQEFKVSSGTYSADQGFSATQINIVSKGGTNNLHGSVFWFDRNDAFDAKPFPTANDYISGTPTANPVLRQNQFGFVAGGPIFIPHLYDGRNKSFFMVNYEGWRITNGARQLESMPNPAILGGDFSAETYKAPSGSGLPGGLLPAYGTADCTKLLDLGYNCMPIDPTTGAAFPGNMIPTVRQTGNVGAVAVKNNFWQTPTLPDQPEGAVNYIKNVGFPLHQNQQTYRGDQNLGKFGSVFFRYTDANYNNQGSYNSSDLVHGYEIYQQQQTSWAVSHTLNLGNTTVNNFRFGHLTANAPQGGPAISADAVSQLALSGTFTKFTALQETWPNVGLSKFGSGGGSVNSYSGSEGPTWEYADSVTSVHGRHTLGFGVDYRRWHLIRNLDDDFYGDWSFGGSLVQNNSEGCTNAPVSVNGGAPKSLCGTGNAVADMLLGYYSGVGGFVPGPLSPTDTAGNPQDHVFGYFAPYAMDDWKVSPKLTLSLGLRWDYRPAAYDADNHFFWLDTQNTNGGLCYADKTLSSNGVAPGGDAVSGPILRYCGSVPHAGSKTPWAPRLGLNYRLTPKTVVRGGYGIFYDSAEGREIDDSADIYPYSIRNSLNPGTNATAPKLTNNMFPSYSTLGPFPASTLTFLAVIESENPLNPYVQSWTASVQRELAANTTIEVNYIGTHAVHLLDRRNIAQPFAIPDASLAFCQTQVGGEYVNLKTDPCDNASRLPYKNFTNFYIDSDWHGYSHYNGMNVKMEHRARELAATVVYTWAQSKDDKSAAAGVGATGAGYQGFMDNHRPELDYGLSDFDVDQRFVASYVYQLPLGRGKKLGGGINRAADLIVGGWETTGIATFQAGFPFSITANDINGVLNSQFMRANRVSGCDPHANLTQKLQRLNMDCFSQPALGTYGDLPRNTLRQPGINNWDMGIGKSFHITERVAFKFNGDFFNAFNHHQYAIGTGALIGSGSGGGSSIDNSVSSTTAGLITSASASRIIQLSGKLVF
ncbi:MAG TPA: carboxypeptidase regulatory-like domain-containing protein [Terracidiphilus sp.]|nr:carboxypeptidase regulatory-like domain-containing protein [Terracidiphilus sp.]